MGNLPSSNKSIIKTKVQLSINDFMIEQLPSIPPKWRYIDPRIWSDFHNKCMSSIPSDADQRRTQYNSNSWKSYYIFGISLFTFGAMYGLGAGVYGGLNRIPLIWLSSIIFGSIFICSGSKLYDYAVQKKKKRGRINQTFIEDILLRLDHRLTTLNMKYDGMIRFKNKGFQEKSIFKNVSIQNANHTAQIQIKIEILSKDILSKKKKSKRKQRNINDVENCDIDDNKYGEYMDDNNYEIIAIQQQQEQMVRADMYDEKTMFEIEPLNNEIIEQMESEKQNKVEEEEYKLYPSNINKNKYDIDVFDGNEFNELIRTDPDFFV